jgi:hypothetical protein
MQALQLQINTLSDKIDALHTAVERISLKLSESVSQPQTCSDNQSVPSMPSYSMHTNHFVEANLGHKDILEDYPYPENHRSEQSLSPELQIQRLTAQLTAAYNRIAALEEQLLSSRVYSHH